jgi:hypothetical protein
VNAMKAENATRERANAPFLKRFADRFYSLHIRRNRFSPLSIYLNPVKVVGEVVVEGVVEGVIAGVTAAVDMILNPPGPSAMPLGTVRASASAVSELPKAIPLSAVRAGKEYDDYMVAPVAALPEAESGQGHAAVAEPGSGPAPEPTPAPAGAGGPGESAVDGPTPVPEPILVPVYVGTFKHFKFHGAGTMYLPCSALEVGSHVIPIPPDFPVLTGTFVEGRLVSGTISAPPCIRGGVVARFTIGDAVDGEWPGPMTIDLL